MVQLVQMEGLLQVRAHRLQRVAELLGGAGAELGIGLDHRHRGIDLGRAERRQRLEVARRRQRRDPVGNGMRRVLAVAFVRMSHGNRLGFETDGRLICRSRR